MSCRLESAASLPRLLVSADAHHFTTVGPHGFPNFGVKSGAVNQHGEDLVQQSDGPWIGPLKRVGLQIGLCLGGRRPSFCDGSESRTGELGT